MRNLDRSVVLKFTLMSNLYKFPNFIHFTYLLCTVIFSHLYGLAITNMITTTLCRIIIRFTETNVTFISVTACLLLKVFKRQIPISNFNHKQQHPIDKLFDSFKDARAKNLKTTKGFYTKCNLRWK